MPLALPDRAAAVRWFAEELLCLMAALDLAVRRGAYEDVWRMAWSVSGFHVLHGQLLEDLMAWEAGLAAAEAIGQPEPLAVTRMYLGAAHVRVGSHEAAEQHVWAALAFARQAECPGLVADAERALGWVLGQRGAPADVGAGARPVPRAPPDQGRGPAGRETGAVTGAVPRGLSSVHCTWLSTT